MRRFPLLFLILLVSGCSSPMLDFSLSFEAERSAAAPVAAVVAVRDFRDLRPMMRGSANRQWLGLIPGVLWVDIPTEVPEVYTVFSSFASRPLPRAVADAFARGLGRSHVFSRVLAPDGAGTLRPDYIFTGTLRRSRLTERCYYYGSFMYAWLTRVFGLPYVSFDLEMVYDVRLVRASDGRVVWKKSFSHSVSDRYHSVYELGRGRGGKHVIASMFSRILAQDMAMMLPEIRSALVEAGR